MNKDLPQEILVASWMLEGPAFSIILLSIKQVTQKHGTWSILEVKLMEKGKNTDTEGNLKQVNVAIWDSQVPMTTHKAVTDRKEGASL